MDSRQVDDWQMPPWNEEALDPLWMPDFGAVDPMQDFSDIAPIVPGIDDVSTFNMSFPYVPASDMSPATDPLPSPGCTLDPGSCQAMAQYERSLQQRQHTLPRRRSKYVLRRAGSRSSPVNIPSGSLSPRPFETQPLAMQRWQNSPPEDEAASLSAICNALDNRPLGLSPHPSRPSSRDAFRRYRGPSSTASLESVASESSLRSWNSGHSTASQANRRSQGPKQRAKGKSNGKNMNAADRIFKCTFCCDTFKHKYDWSRHEKSLHLNMEEWMCTPHGGAVVLPLTGRVHCAYCSALDPTPEHLQEHFHSACVEDRSTPRVFRRKDHLVQHLRLVHGLETLPLIDDWKVESIPVASRCGFCDMTLCSWDERTDHLAAHYRAGKTMADWQGDHGFEPAVSARVTKAFPPWLIASQSQTLVPFSATDPAALDHTNQLLARIELEATKETGPCTPDYDPNVLVPESSTRPLPTQQQINTATFADILSSHLSRFARQQMLLGILPTDEMFQRESRRLLYYDGDDKWNQTVADDPIWLREFKHNTGFDGHPGT